MGFCLKLWVVQGLLCCGFGVCGFFVDLFICLRFGVCWARVVWVLDVGLLWLVFAGFCFVLLVLDLGLFVGLVYFGFLLVWVSVGVCSGVVLGHLFGAVL